MPGRPRLALAAVVVIVTLTSCGNSNSGAPADILGATRIAPESVSLSVASCNQNPFVAEVEQTAPGTYEVLLQTQLPDNGEDCDDGVTIDIDATHPTVVVIDRTSGESINLDGSGQPAPLGLNGVWRMTTVDIGHPVVVGQTTAEIPEVTIRAGEQSGVIEGNFGCNHLRIGLTFTINTMTGQPETLEGSQELCAIPDDSGQLMLTEQTLLDLLSSGQPAHMHLAGDHLEIGTPVTNAVFERISP